MKYFRHMILSGLLVLLGASSLAFSPSNTPTVAAATCTNEKTFLGIKPWYHDVCDGSGKVAIGQGSNGLQNDVWHIVLNVVSIGVSIAGYVAVALVIWGGIKYMLAQGDSGKLTNSKTTIQNALIGLLIALAANAIVTFIAARLS